MHKREFHKRVNWGITFAFLLLCSVTSKAGDKNVKDIFNPSINEKTGMGPTIPQDKHTLTGTVKDQAGEPIIGANVAIKGSCTGAVTDLDGKFTLPVPANAILKISYIGYTEKEIKVGAQKVIEVVMLWKKIPTT